ncbi:MAG: glycosyltransferase 87 family protein, partial [Burkholderiaceae bacterium]|nr:glycosyltransferase 87 family protein [Burkholderiaceae bacterium]
MRARRIFYAFLVLCIIILGVITVYRAAFDAIERTDYTVYVAAGRALLEHRDIYLVQNGRGWRYVYPPPFAILLTPLARMPLALGALLWYLLTVAAIGASAIMSAALLGDTPLRRKPWLVYGLPLFCLSTLLVSGTLRSQASPFMFFFMMATFYFHLKNRPAAAGFSLACAVLLKVFPIVLIVYFILRRQWRAVLASAAALVLLGVALPSLYWGWQFNLHQIARWIDVVGLPAMMQNTERAQVSSLYSQLLDATKPRNQSLEALFLSLGVPAFLTHYAVAASAVLMLAVMWARIRRIPFQRSTQTSQQPDMAENLLCGAFICWSLVISPIAEAHYFGALLLPLTVLAGCVDQSRLRQRRKGQILAAGVAGMVLV